MRNWLGYWMKTQHKLKNNWQESWMFAELQFTWITNRWKRCKRWENGCHMNWITGNWKIETSLEKFCFKGMKGRRFCNRIVYRVMKNGFISKTSSEKIMVITWRSRPIDCKAKSLWSQDHTVCLMGWCPFIFYSFYSTITYVNKVPEGPHCIWDHQNFERHGDRKGGQSKCSLTGIPLVLWIANTCMASNVL